MSIRFGFLSLLVVLAVSATVLAAIPAGAAEELYRIGTDDVLAITVWDNKDLDQLVFVRPDGKISLPLLGEIQAGGLTVSELATRLSDLYSRTVKGAQVTVGVREIRNRQVFFVGGVARPGPVQLTREMTLIQAVAQAGGLAPSADLEASYVLRGKEQIAVDFTQLFQRGNLSQNLVLQPGDTIVVPMADIVYLQGEVRSPGVFKFTKDLTLIKLIAQAGGLTPMGSGRRISVVRQDGQKTEILRMNLNDMMSNSGVDVHLRPNDIVIVPQRIF